MSYSNSSKNQNEGVKIQQDRVKANPRESDEVAELAFAAAERAGALCIVRRILRAHNP